VDQAVQAETPEAEADASGVEPDEVLDVDDPNFQPRSSILLKAAVCLSYAGIVVLKPTLPKNTAMVDVVIFGVCIVALVRMTRMGNKAVRTGAKALPWLWLILVGSLLGLSGVGLAEWGTTDLAISFFSFLSFFCFWYIIDAARLERAAIWGTGIGVFITSVTLLRGGGLRNVALFHQPNYPGHYTVMAACVLVYACRTRWAKALAIVAVIIAIDRTGSFGSVVMSLTVVGVLAWRVCTRYTAILVVGLIVFLIGAIFIWSGGTKEFTSGSWKFSDSINDTRFQRSSGGRFQLWNEAFTEWKSEPFGVGPNGSANRGVAHLGDISLQVHDDMLAYLVERGPIGLLGLVGLWVVLWRAARPRGLARLMIIAVLVAGLFRVTMHYRHVWLLLALAFAIDARKAREARVRAAEEAAAAEAAESTLAIAPAPTSTYPDSPDPGLVWNL
jgi:hypothetical protein